MFYNTCEVAAKGDVTLSNMGFAIQYYLVRIRIFSMKETFNSILDLATIASNSS